MLVHDSWKQYLFCEPRLFKDCKNKTSTETNKYREQLSDEINPLLNPTRRFFMMVNGMVPLSKSANIAGESVVY